jgi:hypothetical protein
MLTPPSTPPELVTLQLDGIIAGMGVLAGTPLLVELQRIIDSGYAAYPDLNGPTSVFLPLVAGPGLSVPLPNFGWTDAYFVKVTAVPEPTAFAAAMLAGVGLLARRRR